METEFEGPNRFLENDMATSSANIKASTDPETLRRGIETLRLFSTVVLFSFAKFGNSLRDSIAGNFVARGMSCTQSIFAVWRAGSEQDAWILHRSLMDRLLHLHYLGESDGFLEFDDFSFRTLYEARNGLLSDSVFGKKVPPDLKSLQRRDRPRYDAIVLKKSQWRRPKAEDIAKAMDLGFLYRFGYDYASRHVHPMAGDGEEDFRALISPPGKIALPDATVVTNSILVQSMLIQEAFNVSRMRWRAIAFDFLEQARSFAGTGDLEFHNTFYRIGKAWPEIELCEPIVPNGGA